MSKITISEPRLFYSQSDETNFFGWLESISGVKSVEGNSEGLELTLSDPVDEETLRELIAILTRYGANMRSLAALCTQENEHWLKDEDVYWYKAIFG